MESWRLFPRYLETMHHLLIMEFLPTNLNLHHLLLSIAPHMCFCPSAQELFLRLVPGVDPVIIKMILSCSNLRKVDFS